MSEIPVIHVKEGLEPWAPAPDAELVRVLHLYDVPLMGVVEQSGQSFLFWCWEGHVEHWNVWGYVYLDPSEVGLLDPKRVTDLLAGLTRSRRYLVVVAEEDAGIVRSMTVEDASQARSVVQSLLEGLSPSDQLSARRSLRLPA